MDQVALTRRILDEIKNEVPLLVSQIQQESDVNKVREYTQKLVAYITVFSMLATDLIDPAMHRSFWPNH